MRRLGNLEKLIAQRDPDKKPAFRRPLYGLSSTWIDYSDDGSIEIRIAASIASIRATGKIGPIRSYTSGVSPERPWLWSENRKNRFWYGSNLAERLTEVLKRRILDAERTLVPRMPLESSLKLHPHDVMEFINDRCDEGKIEELFWAFTIINWKKASLEKIIQRWREPVYKTPLSRTWSLLKLLHTPNKIRDVRIKYEPRIISLISAGRIDEACDLALRRLRVSGLSPFNVNFQEEVEPVRLSAALLLPIKNQGLLENLVLMEK